MKHVVELTMDLDMFDDNNDHKLTHELHLRLREVRYILHNYHLMWRGVRWEWESDLPHLRDRVYENVLSRCFDEVGITGLAWLVASATSISIADFSDTGSIEESGPR